MSEEQKSQNQSWWHTLPGMLTAIAATITALTGLLAALNQAGIFKPSPQIQSPSPQASSSVSTPSPSQASVTSPNPGSYPVQQPVETQSYGKPKKEKKQK